MDSTQQHAACTAEQLLSRIGQGATPDDVSLLVTAVEIAQKAYEGREVRGGRAMMEHSLNVGCILADYHLDATTVAAGLLHNVLPYKGDAASLRLQLGDELFNMIELLESLNVLRFSPDEKEQANQLRQMFIAMAREWRIILIKLANRLDMMRHLDLLPDEEREIFARETLEIFAPLGHRLGVSRLKSEIEDLAFRWLYPHEYSELLDNVEAYREQREHTLKRIIDELKKIFRENNLAVNISGRAKHLYSTYKKMMRQGLLFSELFDLLAVRIIVEREEDCYRALSLLHTTWTPVPDTFDDYIQEPKPNGYQSLHTVVVGPGKLPVEAQIRTWDMHHMAEYGVAAHWRYKEESSGARVAADAANWIRSLADRGSMTNDPINFLQQISLDQFEDRVFVLTPKGRVLTLPFGSTPVDAAYRIHTEVGHRCNGARINNRIAPLDTKLKNGDVVEILTGNHSRPSRDWLKFVRSAGARQKIRGWFKVANRDENISQGREMLMRELDRAGLKRKDILDRIGLESSYKAVKLKDEEDLYASIGCGDVSVEGVITRLQRSYRDLIQQEEVTRKPARRATASAVRHKKQDVLVEGLSDVLVGFSKCCYPLPGDDIVGFVSSGHAVRIHRRSCPSIRNNLKTGERIVPVSWGGGAEKSLYFSTIEVHSLDRHGLLNDIISVVASLKLHTTEVKSKVLKDTTLLTTLRVEVSEIAQTDALIARIERIDDVISVSRQ